VELGIGGGTLGAAQTLNVATHMLIIRRGFDKSQTGLRSDGHR
jgi:hypothetical protein